MGNLCCASKKGKTGRHVERDLTDDLVTLEKKMNEASGITEETLDETQISSSSTPQHENIDKASYAGNKYEQDFLQFLDTNDIFKYGKSQIMDDNFLKFEFFLDFYKQSMMWNKILFMDQKRETVAKRR